MEALVDRFDELTVGMDIPENRRRDWSWLQRNLGIRNSKHENFNEVQLILKELRKQKCQQS